MYVKRKNYYFWGRDGRGLYVIADSVEKRRKRGLLCQKLPGALDPRDNRQSFNLRNRHRAFAQGPEIVKGIQDSFRDSNIAELVRPGLRVCQPIRFLCQKIQVTTPGLQLAQFFFRLADFLLVSGEQDVQTVAVTFDVHAIHPAMRIACAKHFFVFL
jgi:hypothetical protein